MTTLTDAEKSGGADVPENTGIMASELSAGRGTPPLERAMFNAICHHEIAELRSLLSRGVPISAFIEVGGWDPNTAVDENVPLRLEMSFECIKFLLDHGADPNLCGSNGISPLATASLWQTTDIAALLLARGAKPNSKVFHLAVGGGPSNRHQMLKLLTDHGADPNGHDEDGVTPLHHVIEQRPSRLLSQARIWHTKLLLDFGADINEVVDFGKYANISPLVLARATRPYIAALMDSYVPDPTGESHPRYPTHPSYASRP